MELTRTDMHFPDIGSDEDNWNCRPFLDESERQLLVGLAAYQLRYGVASEALAILALCRKIWPNDCQILQLLARALIETNMNDAAQNVVDELSALPNFKGQKETVDLYSSLLLLRHSSVSEARERFSSFISHSTSDRVMEC